MEGDQRREAAIDAEQDDELDLSLGLRPALRRRILYLPNQAAVVRDGSGDLSLAMPIWEKRGIRPEEETDGLGFPEIRAKRQAQALRRKEARKKRDEKRKLKADPSNLMASERLLWRENSGGLRNGVDAAMVEFDGKAVPYLTMPGLAVSDGNEVLSVVGGGGVCDQLKRSISSSSRGSSSGGSDYNSTSGQGGSTGDGGSSSSHSHSLDLTIKSCTTTSNSSNIKPDCNSSPYQTEPTKTTHSACLDQNPELQTKPSPITKKPPKPKATHQTNETASLPKMPCVTTTGNGPDGKRVTGFLYKYSKLEVSIMCICHGASFSPAGFVEHAGGVGIDNPLRHITISPPPPALS